MSKAKYDGLVFLRNTGSKHCATSQKPVKPSTPGSCRHLTHLLLSYCLFNCTKRLQLYSAYIMIISSPVSKTKANAVIALKRPSYWVLKKCTIFIRQIPEIYFRNK